MLLLRVCMLLVSLPAIAVSIKPNLVLGPDSATGKGHPRRSWVEVSRADPRLSPGPRADQRSKVAAADRIRILSYNVLGARQGLSKKHGHVGLDIRNWSTRRDRLREEIWHYNKSRPGGLHVVCLQEVTFRTLGDTWLPFMKRLGLDRHVYQPKSDRPQRRHKSRCLGVAIFFSSKHFEKTAELRVVFSEEARGLRKNSDRKRKVPDSQAATHGRSTHECTRGARKKDVPTDQFLQRVYGGDTGTGGPDGREDPATASRLELDLEEKHDAAAMVRLRIKEDGEREGLGLDGGAKEERAITVVCAHLFYDPRRPDLKTAQCQILFQAIARFHEKCGVAADFVSGGQAFGERSSLGLANLILCADFNSKPVMDPSFLPGPLQAAAEARLCTAAANITSGVPPLGTKQRASTSSKDIYPNDQSIASGVYSLLKYGCVSPEHPEHPDAFIPEFMKVEEELKLLERERMAQDDEKRWTARRSQRPADHPRIRATHHPSGEWVSGFGAALEDVYRDRGVASPCFTTKTSSFSGVIDHLFVSTGEKDSGLAVSGVLAFPRGAHLAEEGAMSPLKLGKGGDGSNEREKLPVTANIFDRRRLDEAEDRQRTSDFGVDDGFPPIPNEIWGSDHLALGVEVALL